jgi:hypothetical protein
MNTCITCIHARRAGNPDMAGCKLWTDIYQGNKKTVTAVLRELSKKLQWGTDMQKSFPGRDGLDLLIEALLKEYAPQPLFEGWMDPDVPYGDEYIKGTMTNFCVIVDPNRLCTFYKSKND